MVEPNTLWTDTRNDKDLGELQPTPLGIEKSHLDLVLAMLIKQGVCDDGALKRASTLADEGNLTLPQALVKLGLLTERVLAQTFSAVLSLPIATPDRYPDSPVLSDSLRPRFLRSVRMLPLEIAEDHLVIAVVNPLDYVSQGAIRLATGHDVKLEIAVPIELELALDRLYPEDVAPTNQNEQLISEDDAERLKDLASEAPTIKLVYQIIARAVETNASDIHIEPLEDRVRVRYRFDGDLQDADTYPLSMMPAIISRLKILAKLDIAERRLPQDGRIRMNVRGQEVVLRIATAPSLHGEIAVLRILDRNTVEFDFKLQGHSEYVIGGLESALIAPNGMILVTGPTGSGKTTTLYTALMSLNATERKIITVEDPIEYQLIGIMQMQVKPQINLTFARALRALVRLDPDVIMIGEIRDLETAQIAARSALTGHLVLSTLHTNSAVSAVTRLRDMGLEDYLVSSVLRGVLAQRLVRKLCETCKEPIPTPAEFKGRFSLETEAIFFPRGCAACRNTGYRGRLAIAEFLTPDTIIQSLIQAKADQQRLEQAAISGGMQTMFQAGMIAVTKGETTVEEVLRVVQADYL